MLQKELSFAFRGRRIEIVHDNKHMEIAVADSSGTWFFWEMPRATSPQEAANLAKQFVLMISKVEASTDIYLDNKP